MKPWRPSSSNTIRKVSPYGNLTTRCMKVRVLFYTRPLTLWMVSCKELTTLESTLGPCTPSLEKSQSLKSRECGSSEEKKFQLRWRITHNSNTIELSNWVLIVKRIETLLVTSCALRMVIPSKEILFKNAKCTNEEDYSFIVNKINH